MVGDADPTPRPHWAGVRAELDAAKPGTTGRDGGASLVMWERLTFSTSGLHDPHPPHATLADALRNATAEATRTAPATPAIGVVPNASAARGEAGRPVAAAHGFGEGCVALVLGGCFDRAAVDDLDQLVRRLRPWASVRLVVDLGAVGAHHPRLGRVLGRWRVRCLIDGTGMLLCHLPDDLADELDLPADDDPALVGPPEPDSPRRDPR